MIGLVHGYGLSGSGSNLWTRSVAEALAYTGEGVHLICQERAPEELPFVSEARTYDAQGTPEVLFSRTTDYAGPCTLHRPVLEQLPVFVRPPASSSYLAYMPDLTEEEVEAYLTRNVQALHRIVEEAGLTALHVNHTVLMSEVCRRVHEATGVPYAVMPHGSAIEYVVKRDARFQQIAAGALQTAQRVFVLSNEMQDRLRSVFPEVDGLTEKMRSIKTGVNTRQFALVSRDERAESIARLKAVVETEERGKSPEQERQMQERLAEAAREAGEEGPPVERLRDILEEAGRYNERRPDAGLEAKLDGVDWNTAEVVTFVGRLISYKGIQSIVAALPLILRARPDVRVVMAGAGPLREVLDALVFALAEGDRSLARQLARHGGTLEGEKEGALQTVTALFDRLEEEGALADYFITAETHLQPDTVLFTGYLEHEALCHLFPCCDVAVFPSTVAEGAPLVVPEAMASGCYPMGTNFAGMKDSLDAVEQGLHEGGFTDEETALLRLRPEPEHTAWDIAQHVPQALELGGRQRPALRRVADERFSWRGIAESLSKELEALRREGETA